MLDHKEFITTYTKLQYLEFVPELRLFLREDINLYYFLQQELGNNTPFPYWAHSWAGGQALARYILDNPDTVKNKHVVDYCSGSGIIGIAAMIAGALSATCVDIDEISLSAARLNARANNVSIDISDSFEKIDLLLSGDPTPTPDIFSVIDNYPALIGCPIRNAPLIKHYQGLTTYFFKTNEFLNGTDVSILTNI